ncbi:hypothetical protein ACLQ3K_22010 [Tsukamurella sp. DT100]|uniref:hypothetical protein n=1 Tax=Tsukamurella sp. DT100 TaxID=3393415 RepID=UPI003CF28CA1
MTDTQTRTLTAKDFETVYDDNHTFPFFEDENGYGIYGYGHIDKAEFARLVSEYDALAQFGPDDEITADDVNHTHAKVIEVADLDYEWRLEFAPESADTIPVTWVQR